MIVFFFMFSSSVSIRRIGKIVIRLQPRGFELGKLTMQGGPVLFDLLIKLKGKTSSRMYKVEKKRNPPELRFTERSSRSMPLTSFKQRQINNKSSSSSGLDADSDNRLALCELDVRFAQVMIIWQDSDEEIQLTHLRLK